MNTTKYISAKISNTGMGGAFNPPSHPTHTHSVETDLNRGKENRGSMSLEYALTQEYISLFLKNKIKALIREWDATKLPLTDSLVMKWVDDVIRYMGEGNGIDHIKKYYPEYK